MHIFSFALSTGALACLVGCSSSTPITPRSEALVLEPGHAAAVEATAQPTYDTPEAAVAALYAAAVAKDLDGMTRIAGLSRQDVTSGDAEQDARQMEHFATAHGERLDIVVDGDQRRRVFLGHENYPLASPLVCVGDRWRFDSVGGRTELLARVIGENELATIGVCRAYVMAQYEYYAEDRNGDDVLQYAQRLASTKGNCDGLYWHAAAGETESPLGLLIAEARAGGYLHGSARQLDEPKPYHGYLFKVLTAQGENAPGGSYSYLVHDRMVAGFALVAYPAKWNHCGVMTFVVGANGKVYQKDLGEGTATLVAEMVAYDPDASWTLVRD